MNYRAYAYVALITLMAVAIIAAQPWIEFFTWPTRDHLGIASFVFLGLLAEALAINFTVGPNRTAHSSIGFLPLLACAIIFPAFAAIFVAATIEIVAGLFIRKRSLWVLFFNTAQGVVSVATCALVYSALGGEPSGGANIHLAAFVGLAIAFFLSNGILVGLLYAIRQNTNPILVIRTIVGPRGGNILYGLLASPVAIFAAILYDRLYVGGLALMILPLLLVRYSYLSKVQLEQVNRDLLKVLIKAIETRDPYTSGHSLRVSNIARVIAEDIGLSRRKVEEVETAGLLHDIGKIDMIYAAIIQKPSGLTEDEKQVIKTHAVKGAELLRSLTSFGDSVISGVLHHHERYDGKGYPDGLSGKEIPLTSRIIMLSDSIDAMLSDRPYRPALSVEEVEAEILRCSGTQFDPDIVRVIVERGTLGRVCALVRDDIAAAHDHGMMTIPS